jgi:hypothetical protein
LKVSGLWFAAGLQVLRSLHSRTASQPLGFAREAARADEIFAEDGRHRLERVAGDSGNLRRGIAGLRKHGSGGAAQIVEMQIGDDLDFPSSIECMRSSAA